MNKNERCEPCIIIRYIGHIVKCILLFKKLDVYVSKHLQASRQIFSFPNLNKCFRPAAVKKNDVNHCGYFYEIFVMLQNFSTLASHMVVFVKKAVVNLCSYAYTLNKLLRVN